MGSSVEKSASSTVDDGSVRSAALVGNHRRVAEEARGDACGQLTEAALKEVVETVQLAVGDRLLDLAHVQVVPDLVEELQGVRRGPKIVLPAQCRQLLVDHAETARHRAGKA